MKKLFSVFFCLVLTFGIVIAGLSVQDKASAKNEDLKLKVFVHYPNPGKPVAVSTCQATTNATVGDYGLTGWNMPASGMNYKINYSTVPANLSQSQVSTAIADSFGTWSSADSAQIFNYAGSTTAKTSKLDGTNAIFWKAVNGGALAITYSWYNRTTHQLVESDTAFNRNYKWSWSAYTGANDCGGVAGTYDLQNIATHEFGHWVGLDDLYAAADSDLTMYGYGDTKELKKDSLGTGDVNGITAVAP